MHRLAVIGVGVVARAHHLPAIAAEPRAQLVALASLEADATAEAARRFSAERWTTNYRDVLEAPDIRAVVICTPAHVTPQVTLDALAAGKDVLVEKPIALDLASAHAIDRAVRQSRRMLQIGLKNRFSPLMIQARNWIRAGRLGSPLVFNVSVYDEKWDPADRVQHEHVMHVLEQGLTPIADEGAHIADYLTWLAGERVVRVRALAHRSRPEIPVPNYWMSWLEMERGSLADVQVGWLYPHMPGVQIRVFGPLGLIQVDRSKRELTLQSADGEETVHMSQEWNAACFPAQLSAFLAALDGETAPSPDVGDAVASLRVTTAIEEAAKSDAAIELDWRSAE